MQDYNNNLINIVVFLYLMIVTKLKYQPIMMKYTT